jgi:cytochrome b561
LCRDARKPQESYWAKTAMHFGFYLMIAALVLMGVEALYALYQLANFFLWRNFLLCSNFFLWSGLSRPKMRACE